jgi:hypothetical protein
LPLARALSLIAAEASQSHTPAARTDKFREIHRNSPTTILYSYMVISQLDRRVNVAPMMDWSDEVNSEKNLNDLGHRQKSCPHFVTTIRSSQRCATELPHTWRATACDSLQVRYEREAGRLAV